FNDKLYFWVLKPVKIGYSYVLPAEVRESFGNFFNNLSAPIRLINNLLQGRFQDAGVVFSRFLINSTVGVYGLADVALQEYNLEPRIADFGQTLGFYGIGEGLYLVWPLLGPSNIRHSAGLVGDLLASPVTYLDMTSNQSVLYYSVNRINNLSLSPGVYEEIKKFSLDPYVAARQSFFDFRRNVVKRATNEETDF
ncbi:MAG TPA: VacJ family lipoprotein, partial [Desulfopila sp.]|nr:VacJ family lipoprotein [Desulfopila sp.]